MRCCKDGGWEDHEECEDICVRRGGPDEDAEETRSRTKRILVKLWKPESFKEETGHVISIPTFSIWGRFLG